MVLLSNKYYLLDNETIVTSGVTHAIYAKQYIKADQFKTFTEYMYNNYSESDAKQMCQTDD